MSPKTALSRTTTLSPDKSAMRFFLYSIGMPLLILLSACTPTVKVATEEPITINLNVKIEHEILVRVDKELDGLFDEDSALF